MEKLVGKEFMEGLVEPFLLEKLEGDEYACSVVPASYLLTCNRFDLGFKLSYLYLKDKLPSLAREIYFHDIRSQTMGSFEEYGNEQKNTFERYLNEFDSVYESIGRNGFDLNKTLVPLSNKGCILNGAHRVASSIYLNKDIGVVRLELDSITPDYKYFYEKGVPGEYLDYAAIKFSELADNIYIAFLWPSGRKHKEKSEQLFENVVYEKEIKLTEQGGVNLLIELYKHMDWVGDASNGFPGAYQKLLECFPTFDSFKVIMFQSGSLEEVQKVKQKVRDINQIGFSSVHITDTKEEAERIAKLVFNKNGLHFLNYAEPYRCLKTIEKLTSFRQFLHVELSCEPADIVVDGSAVLGIYGLRDAFDIDFLSSKQIDESVLHDSNFDLHDSELKYHKLNKNQLIYNPSYYFEYLGLKFVSYEQAYAMKKTRGDEKDINDCKYMVGLIKGGSISFVVSRVRYSFFYKKVLFKQKVKRYLIKMLKAAGAYEWVRNVYRKLR